MEITGIPVIHMLAKIKIEWNYWQSLNFFQSF
jgi:hypothetical protein